MENKKFKVLLQHIGSPRAVKIAASTFVLVVAVILGYHVPQHTPLNSVGTNQQLGYQARLLDSTGAVVPDGTYNMEFKIYQDGTGCASGGTSPCGGTLKWTETRTTTNRVTVRNGYFSVQLGEVNPFGTSVDWNQDTLWLSINIGGTNTSPTWDGEMTPFRRLSSTPYAMNAANLGGIAASGFVQLAPGSAQTDSSTNSSIFLNKTGASGNMIQLQKNGLDMLTVDNTGSLSLLNSNSSSAFKVANSIGDTALNLDTTNTNLISNPSFETNTTGWSTVNGNNSGNSPTLTRDTSTAAFGNASMSIATNADPNEGARFFYNFAANTTYSMTIFVKGATNFSTMEFGRADNGAQINCASAQSVSQAWNRFTCSFTTGATISSSFVYIRQSDGTARTFNIDGVMLEAGSTPSQFHEGQLAFNGGLALNTTPTANGGNGLTVRGTGENGFSSRWLFALQDINGNNKVEYTEEYGRFAITGGNSFFGTAALELTAQDVGSVNERIRQIAGQTSNTFELLSSSSQTRYVLGAGDYTDTSGSKAFQTIAPSFAPTASSTASFTATAITPIVNFAGGGAGNTTALLVNPSYFAPPTGLNILADFQNGGTSVMKVDSLGQVTIQTPFLNSTTAVNVLDLSATPDFQVDTTNDRVIVGNPTGDTTGALLVTDNKTGSGDPTGVNGAIYYNSGGTGGAGGASGFAGKFRCYEGSLWKNCLGMRDIAERRWGYLAQAGAGSGAAQSLVYSGVLASGIAGATNASGVTDTLEGTFANFSSATSAANVGFVATAFTSGAAEGRQLPKIVTRVRTASSLASIKYWVALSSATIAATSPPTTSAASTNKYIGVGYASGVNSGKWVCGSGDGTNMSGTDTGVTVTASHSYDIIVDLTTAGTLVCSVADVTGAGNAAFTTVTKTSNLITSTDSTTLGLTVGGQLTAAATETVGVEYVYLERQ